MSLERRLKVEQEFGKSVYLICEGSKTEPNYFVSISKTLKGRSIMDLIVIPKIFNSTTRSNPINVFNIMDRYSRWIRQEGMECEVFVEQFLREVSMKYPLLKDLCNKTSTQKTLSGIIEKSTSSKITLSIVIRWTMPFSR